MSTKWRYISGQDGLGGEATRLAVSVEEEVCPLGATGPKADALGRFGIRLLTLATFMCL